MRVSVSFTGFDKNGLSVKKIVEIIGKLEKCGVDTIHWDIMDGIYNSNNTLKYQGPEVIKLLREYTNIDFESHLMISKPWCLVKKLKTTCSKVIFQLESCKTEKEVIKTINKIKEYGKVGIAIEPDTKVEALLKYLSVIDFVLIMTVKTGYSGQSFLDMTNKIKDIKKLKVNKGLKFEVGVDGGINDKTINIIKSCGGCDAANSSAYILNNDYKHAIKVLKLV